MDYAKARITFRDRTPEGKRRLVESFGTRPPVRTPFFMTGTHLMFAKGSLSGHQGLNLLLDSGLAMSVPGVIVDETVALLGLPRTPVPNTRFYQSWIASFGLGDLTRGPDPAVGIFHQYLWHLGSWTIDFDTMSHWFPSQESARG